MMRALFRIARLQLVVCLGIASAAVVASAQCVPHPSHETAISVINASSWPITFSVDGVTRATVPAADVSIDFNVGPGQHLLLAHTSVGDEKYSISRRLVIPAGSICVWTVTNPSKDWRRPQLPLFDPLMRIAVIPLAIPIGL